jgi:hypothetical protein
LRRESRAAGPALSRSARFALAALFAAAALWLAWLLSWSSVRTLLASDATARAAAWERGGTPWHWRLAAPGAVIWPGSRGFEREHDTGDVLAGSIPDGNADLSLDLQGEAVDLTLVAGATLGVRTQQPVRATLIGGDGPATAALASAPVSPPGGVVSFAAPEPLLQHARTLRLHLEAPPGARVTLRELKLTPREDLHIADCTAAPSCAQPLARIATPDFVFPESLLRWRDQLLLERPASLIEPRGDGAVALAAEVRAAARGKFAWLLALTPVFVGLMSRLRRGEISRGIGLLELALVCSPWLMLQWAGWPGPESPEAPNFVLGGCLLGAALLRGDPGWRWFGTRHAWTSAGVFALIAAVAIALAAFANIDDGDGFSLRPPGLRDVVLYAAWALLQQWILMQAIVPRLRRTAGLEGFAALASGALFAALHTPNFALMVATFAAGTVWAALGLRHRALLPLALVHALAGLALVWAAPPWLLRSAEIGGRYLMAP